VGFTLLDLGISGQIEFNHRLCLEFQ